MLLYIACLLSAQQNSPPLIVCIITYYTPALYLLVSIRQKVHKIIRQHSNGTIMQHSDTSRLGRFRLLTTKHTPLELSFNLFIALLTCVTRPAGSSTSLFKRYHKTVVQ